VREREQDSRETKTESVLEADHCGEREMASENKIDHERKTCGVNVRLISEVIKNVANDVVPTICSFSLLLYKRHLDPMTSRKLLIIAMLSLSMYQK
jgi:hypothetical protein